MAHPRVRVRVEVMVVVATEVEAGAATMTEDRVMLTSSHSHQEVVVDSVIVTTEVEEIGAEIEAVAEAVVRMPDTSGRMMEVGMMIGAIVVRADGTDGKASLSLLSKGEVSLRLTVQIPHRFFRQTLYGVCGIFDNLTSSYATLEMILQKVNGESDYLLKGKDRLATSCTTPPCHPTSSTITKVARRTTGLGGSLFFFINMSYSTASTFLGLRIKHGNACMIRDECGDTQREREERKVGSSQHNV